MIQTLASDHRPLHNFGQRARLVFLVFLGLDAHKKEKKTAHRGYRVVKGFSAIIFFCANLVSETIDTNAVGLHSMFVW